MTSAFAQVASQNVIIQELDNSPKGKLRTLKVDNSTLTKDAEGIYTYRPSNIDGNTTINGVLIINSTGTNEMPDLNITGTLNVGTINATTYTGLPTNTNTSAGIVSSGAGKNALVWKTDADGNPDWRADATGAGGTGITDINTLNATSQTLATSNSTLLNITSATATHTFTPAADLHLFSWTNVVDADIPDTITVGASGSVNDAAIPAGITRDTELVGANEAYGAGWNADTGLPEKDDIYDYLHLIDTDDDGAVDNINSTLWATKQAADADLTTWAGVTPSANGQSLVSAANYAAMRGLLDLEAATDFYSIAAADSEFINASELDAVDNLNNYQNSTEAAAAYQAKDSDLTDLADGELTASKVGGVKDADYGEVVVSSGAWALENDALDDQYYDSEADLTGLLDNNYQPLEATLTDIADGTIAENLVNTANPWADNEVADTLTIGANSTIQSGASVTTDAAGELGVRTGAASAGGFQAYGAASTFWPAYYSKSFFIYNLTATDDIPLWKTPIAVTIRALHAVCTIGAANVTLGEFSADGASPAVVDSAWMNVSSTNVNDDGSLSNSAGDANDWYGLVVNNCTTDAAIAFTFEYTYD